MRIPVTVSLLVAALASGALVGCGSSQGPADGGQPAQDAGNNTTELDAGQDAGRPQSACGQPGDRGNSRGVGKYCVTQGDCADAGAATTCSTIESVVLPADAGVPPSNFCLIAECNPCNDPVTECGENAFCACFQPGLCGCAPDSCAAAFGLDAGATCADGG